ncbi:hypothetical protein [Streptomyces hygroscopicus]|uniref:hypothetical protein n=1 Tax=Streptomyces hygroscopicus TaxID=1912 RepID=UPI0036D16A58
MAVIRTPVKDYSGPGVAGLHFVDGQAETDDPAVIAYAQRHGYDVEGAAPKRKSPAKTETPKE